MTREVTYDELIDLVEGLGVPESHDGYAVEFNNVMLGSPHITDTGYLPDKETAEGVAAVLLPVFDVFGAQALTEHPELGECWTHPESEATSSWARIVSAARQPFGDDPEGGDPVYEEEYHGDAWFNAGVALGMLSDDERRVLDKVRAVLP